MGNCFNKNLIVAKPYRKYSVAVVLKLLQYLLIIFPLLFCLNVQADEYPILLEKANINTHDVRSIQRGARAFANYCLVCHSLIYMAHDPFAKAAGITPDKMPDKNKKWWFGASPPDLTLIARVYNPNWLYTYLHVFYADPSRPIGTNNLLMDNVNMPNPFLGIQGEQILIVDKKHLLANSNLFVRRPPYYSVLKLSKQGGMTPDEFDKMTRDLVNFLVYASDPRKYTREMLGIGVLIFIVIFYILVYLLKREYWKDVKK